MSFFTDNGIETMMALNSFCPQFDPQSIPPYVDWVANAAFDPFGPEPLAPTLHPNPGAPFLIQTRDELRIEGDLDVESRAGRGPGSLEDGMSQGRSRFAFAQKPVGHSTYLNAIRTPAARVHHSPVHRSRSPIPIRNAPARRVIGPRPLQRAVQPRKIPTLAIPKPTYPLPEWLTNFEDHEQELLAEFCPSSEGVSPSTTTFPGVVRVRLLSEHLPDCPPLNTGPLLRFTNSGYADIEGGGRYLEEDEDPNEEDEGYDPSEFDTNSEFGTDPMSYGSESSAPASYGAGAFDWSARSRARGGGGYSCASAVTDLGIPPRYPFSPPPVGIPLPSFGSFDLAAELPRSVFTNPPAGAPIMASPAVSSVVSSPTRDPTGGYIDGDRFFAEMEEGLGPLELGPLSGPSEVLEVGRWYDRFDLTGYIFPIPPQQPHSPCVTARSETPPPLRTATIPLPNAEEEGSDAELDPAMNSTNPWFGWWC